MTPADELEVSWIVFAIAQRVMLILKISLLSWNGQIQMSKDWWIFSLKRKALSERCHAFLFLKYKNFSFLLAKIGFAKAPKSSRSTSAASNKAG